VSGVRDVGRDEPLAGKNLVVSVVGKGVPGGQKRSVVVGDGAGAAGCVISHGGITEYSAFRAFHALSGGWERLMGEGKVIRHRCGYPLRIASLGFVGDEAVVVIYREAAHFSLPLYHCPNCGEELRLWWDAPPAVAAAHRRQQQQLLTRLLGPIEGEGGETDG
jgi:hypothetical protein